MRSRLCLTTTLFTALALCLALAGCSGSSNDKDAGLDSSLTDTAPLPDGYNYWPCKPEEEGKSCNAHDPCAIDPICTRNAAGDLVCVPTALQDCKDELDCTEDICKGMGLCENVPKSGFCALPVKIGGTDAGVGTTEIQCFKKDEADPNDPCMLCDPDNEPTKWSPANGGACDDGNACTKDDYCQSGVCKGVDYSAQCADTYGCTDDLCDGTGGCLGNELKSDWCLINGVCYKDQATHPDGSCNICDVSKSQSAWTAISDTCMIGGKCYNKDAQHPSGDCAICDPSKSASAWTTTGKGCLIDNTCHKDGDKDSIQCSVCDPSKATDAWTPLTGLCKIGGTCYSQGDKHTGGCAECDTATSATSWTVVGAYCLIQNVCKNPKDQDSIACSECDPTKDKYDWTPLSGKCKIAGKCYSDQQADTTGCLLCDYSTDPTAWTPVSGALSTAYDFETGQATGWTLTGTDTSVKWQVATTRPGSGQYSLYYGDPVTKDYDGSGSNSGTATMPPVQLTASKKAGISFSLYMDTEGSTSYDTLKVYVGSTKVWEKDQTQTITMQQWESVTIDLSTYAGQTVTIKFEFDTVDSVANSSEGVFIDDITIYHNC